MKYQKRVIRGRKRRSAAPVLLVLLLLLVLAVAAILIFFRPGGGKTPSDLPSSTPVSSAAEPTGSDPVSEPEPSSEPAPSSAPEPLPAYSDVNGLLVVGDAAYEYYNYVKNTAAQYTDAINKLADQLNGRAKLYDLIIPTGMDVVLQEGIRTQLPASDQRDSINRIYGDLNAAVTPVPVLDTLLAHKNEYLYFRTDHHWTAQAAYYAYAQFMQVKGGTATPLSGFTPLEFPGFLGSFYRSVKSELMAQNPDTVYAYRPKETNILKATTAKGEAVTLRIVGDTGASSESSKYLCFIGGDQPYSVIENPRKTDGSVCIVVKESFGNAFVPFLTGHYQTIHVVDYRYFDQIDNRTLSQLVTDTGASEVIFVNNISATRNKSLVASLTKLVG